MKKNTNNKVYEIIQAEILKKLDQGVIPWNRSWNTGEVKNIISKKNYRGFNAIWLSCQGYSSEYWLTYKQAKQLKGNVKKGESGTIIIFWKILKKTVENDQGEWEQKKIPLLRYYRVFNLEQTEGIETTEETKTVFNNDPIENCEKIVFEYSDKPEIIHGQNPHYNLTTDKIGLPYLKSFQGSEEYYSTLFHEMGHSTRHPSRLNREKTSRAKEELVAEMTASFLCGVAGIDSKVIDNQASYIDGWRKRISEDAKLIISASTQAQKASDYILNNNQYFTKQAI
ncbi:MAG: ssDNA-binding domain-containing protein [Desulfobacteraceae bacterium]|nr:ssDNA-binding domain-containing protein [Desulfobacteraceae bacterium]